MFSRWMLSCAAVMFACAVGQQPPSLRGRKLSVCPEAHVAGLYHPYGVDLKGRNLSMLPGNDFFDYAGGQYLENLQIPADKSSWGVTEVLEAEVRQQVLKQLHKASAEGTKVGRFFKSFMDEHRVEERGSKPLKAYLNDLMDIGSAGAFANFSGQSVSSFMPSPFGIDVTKDAKDPDRYIIFIDQGGLGLPDRSYYLDSAKASIKKAYEGYIVKLLELAEWPDAKSSAASVLAFEERVAKASWSPEQMRDPAAVYNPVRSVSELHSLAPGFEWTSFLKATGAPVPAHNPANNQTSIVIGALSAVTRISKIINETALPVLKAWQAFHLAVQSSFVLSADFTRASMELRTMLTGVTETLPRWERAIQMLSVYMRDAVGEVYVDKYFPPAAKAETEEMVENLKKAFASRIQNLDWMSNASKTKAVLKLTAMKSYIGYPDKFENYTNLDIGADNLYGNVLNAKAFQWKKSMSKLGKPADKTNFDAAAYEVNAFYEPTDNSITFPAGILQPPFFNFNAISAVNYGALGAVIGHEMTHGFDDEGSLYDVNGKLSDWWTPEDRQRFEALVNLYGKQFATYTIGLPAGAHINPKLTAGENIADFGGLNIALDAYLAKRSAQVPCRSVNPPDIQQDIQEFYLAYAQSWREKKRPRALMVQLSVDFHSPDIARTNVPLSNMDQWYTAFNVSKDALMFRTESGRVKIW